MKWDTIKDNCIRAACTDFRSNNTDISLIVLAVLQSGERPLDWKGTIRRRLAKEIEDEIVRVIERWDIRQHEKLRSLFPSCFKGLLGIAELTDNGWEVI